MKEKVKGETNYLIFARKFRPETFDEIVGQEMVTRLLKNAIRSGRIPQNFLFAGPRGIGKTSTARILAKALNCTKGVSESPCNQCVVCEEITRGISFDVLEIDGASNRGIDEVRTLRENVKFKPASARFKIYIIDEVHMLTGEAFNALLKTLEEPPEHVKFIFATTEPHKLPLTILSRCQRFNFKRIPTATIVAKLNEIASLEKLRPEPGALSLIARSSDGSLRDAETLLDQLSVLSKGQIREEDVLFALGLASEEAHFEILEALQKKEAEKILGLIQGLYESGKDLVRLGRSLYEFFRNLLLLQIGGGTESFIEMSDESKKRLAQFRDVFSREELLLTLSLFQNLQGELRRALAPPKLLLETTLLKLLHLEGLQEVRTLIEKAEGGKSAAIPSLRGGNTSGAEAISESGLRSLSRASEIASPRKTKSAGLAMTGEGSPSGPPRNDESERGGPPHPSPLSPSILSLNQVEAVWPRVLEAVKAKEMSTGMFLAEASPVEVTPEAIVLGLPEEFQFHKETLERPEKTHLVKAAFAQFLARELQIQFVTTRIPAEEKGPGPFSKASDPKIPEIVRQAMDIFQGSKVIRREDPGS